MPPCNLLVVLGPTASGKTSLAAHLALRMNGEVVSADSRQVYIGMDLGTGKDLDDFNINGQQVATHLIDIRKPGYKYNVFEYQRDFISVFQMLHAKGRLPVLCGGTGLYLDAVLNAYRLIEVPPDPALRARLEQKSLPELADMLASFKKMHNKTDIDTKKRAIRALEIEIYCAENKTVDREFPDISPLIIGVKYDRESRRQRITQRLMQRLKDGMVEEVAGLLDSGLSPDDLIYYGLEYKYITLFLTNRIGYSEMTEALNTAIHQFAKRQMTWFRGMERRGVRIHWLDGYAPLEEKIARVTALWARC